MAWIAYDDTHWGNSIAVSCVCPLPAKWSDCCQLLAFCMQLLQNVIIRSVMPNSPNKTASRVRETTRKPRKCAKDTRLLSEARTGLWVMVKVNRAFSEALLIN